MTKLSCPGWLVTKWDSLPAGRQSPIQVLTGLNVDFGLIETNVLPLRYTKPPRYASKAGIEMCHPNNTKCKWFYKCLLTRYCQVEVHLTSDVHETLECATICKSYSGYSQYAPSTCSIAFYSHTARYQFRIDSTTPEPNHRRGSRWEMSPCNWWIDRVNFCWTIKDDVGASECRCCHIPFVARW